MEASILSVLERAERDAEDRRRRAEAEADRLIRDARDRARGIEAAATTRAEAAVAEMRRVALDAARAEAGRLAGAGAGVWQPIRSELPDDSERFMRAVRLVIAAVLDEPDPAAEGAPSRDAAPSGTTRSEAAPC